MPNKIKIILTLVAIVAVFSVYKLAQYVHVVAEGGPTYQSGSSLPSPDQDSDHDGLSDQQEMIWGTDPFNPDTDSDGFKDGEEVKSGHNPLVPGPDDLISQDNLTDQLSQLTVAGIAAGDLKSDSPNYDKSLQDITSSIVDSGTYLFNKTFDPSELTVINGDSKVNLTYVQVSAPLIQKFSKTFGDQVTNINTNLNTIGDKGFTDTVKNFFSQQVSVYDSILKDGVAMSVPKPFVNSHANFLSLVQQMSAISDAIAHGDTDAIKATLAFNAVGEMYQKYIDFLTVYTDILLVEHVDLGPLNNISK